MAAVHAQHGLDILFEILQHIKGNKSLHRTGKTTAVHTVSAFTLKECIAHGQRDRHRLQFGFTRRIDVL